MKFFAKLVATAALSLVPALASAQQGHTIAYGRATINFSASFQQTLSNLGASLTDLNLHPFINGVANYQGTQGVIDLQSGIGEFNTNNGYAVSAGGALIQVQNLTFDFSNPSSPVVTGVFVINGTVQSRVPIFNVQVPSGFSLPFTATSGVAQLNGFTLTLAPAAANTINSTFGGPVLQANSNVGSANVYAVLAASGGII